MNIIAIVMAGRIVTVGRVEAVRGTGTADWLLPVLRSVTASVSFPRSFFISFIHCAQFIFFRCLIFLCSFLSLSPVRPFFTTPILKTFCNTNKYRPIKSD